MSENVETMKRGFAAFSRGDWDACLAEIDPAIEWHVTFRFPDLPPDKTVFHGHDEVRVLFDGLAAAFDELSLDLEEVLYERGDLQIVRARFVGRGGATGIEVDRRLFYVQELRDQLLFRQRPFDTEAEAFAAAGVERDD
jgi:ketosteroid isomerase-like protein